MSKKNKTKRFKLTTNLHNVYTGLVAFLVLGLAFFYTSKVLFVDAADILETSIDEELFINSNTTFTINEWIYDKETSKMQVTLLTNNMTDHLSDLKFISVSKTNPAKELPVKIVYSTRDIYIVMIEDIPKNFEQVAIRLVKEEVNFDALLEFDEDKSKKEEEEFKRKVLASIYTDERVVAAGEVKQQKVKEYALKVTNELIKQAEDERESVMYEVQKNTIITSKIEDEITLLKEEIIYQTTSEQDETNNKIFNLEKQIEEYLSKNAELLKDVDSIDSKIKRLTQRKRDLQY